MKKVAMFSRLSCLAPICLFFIRPKRNGKNISLVQSDFGSLAIVDYGENCIVDGID